ncbi:Hypothetical_protein [Hexamita inflata]|uniref:Hypothetical_protein n=1 Tax=Hexamita inflata TaxID=28002 RepID=A0AA86NB76_9EUKA|nr:Hypothetical protein HINF_LOCUS4119 [Hexamita inflata]CAI9949509.1 Hypothetical protein HINF_LOCUS37154 [Hexamita inflata]
MQFTTKPLDETTFNQLIQSINTTLQDSKKNAFRLCDPIFKSLSNTKDDIPELSMEQVDQLLKLIEPSTAPVMNSFRQLLSEFKIKIQNLPSSEFKLQIDDQTLTLYRMNRDQFNKFYINMKTTKTYSKKLFEYVKAQDAHVSISQLKLFSSCFKTESICKKLFLEKIAFIERHMIKQEQINYISKEQFYNNIQSSQSADEIIQCFDYINNFHPKEIPNTTYEHDEIIPVLINILQDCIRLQDYASVLDPNFITATNTIIPLIIYKSFQIIINYPEQYKVVNSLIFIYEIPICYLTEDDITAEGLLIMNIKDDIHLKNINNKHIHLQYRNNNIENQINQQSIVHHINSNEFDNRESNLITLTVSQDEIDTVNQFYHRNDKYLNQIDTRNYTLNVKHQYIHQILNFDYFNNHKMFFHNAIDLQYFDSNNSFYKVFINEHINDANQMIKEIIDSIELNIQYEAPLMLRYLMKRSGLEL